MKGNNFLACIALAGGAVATGTLEFPLSKRDASGRQSDIARGVLWKRQDTTGTLEESVYDVQPWSLGGAYYTNISVGTPPQVQTVILDTGSSDTYLDASDAAACESNGPYSCRGGSFDHTASSTYKVINPNGFQTAFGDGSSASGDFATDVVQIGDVSISNVQFGVASDVNSTTGYAVGLMGIGYSLNEASSTQYANMPEVLRDAGVINSRLYSVFLNDLGDASGTILFGGIDTSKYTGSLTTLNLIPVPVSTTSGTEYVVYEFVVAVTGLVSTGSGSTVTYLSGGAADGSHGSLPVLLDTGSAAWTVPTSIYNKIARLLPSMDQYGYLPCSAQSTAVNLNITFGGSVQIEVPLSDLIVPVFDADTNQQNLTSSGEPLCTFMMTAGEATKDQPFLTLGDSILRSMYVVFDLDNGQVSIAQAKTNSTTDSVSSGSGDSIKVVQAGTNGVAKALGSGVSTISANPGTIAPAVTVSTDFSFVTSTPAVGTATGTNAVPEDGRVTASTVSGSSGSTGSGSSSSGSRSSGTAASGSSSKGSASGLAIPPVQWSVFFSGLVVMIGMAGGAALIL